MNVYSCEQLLISNEDHWSQGPEHWQNEDLITVEPLKQLTEPASCSSLGREFQIRGARLEKDTVPEVEEERYGT